MYSKLSLIYVLLLTFFEFVIYCFLSEKMESVYSSYHFRASDPLDVKEYFENFSDLYTQATELFMDLDALDKAELIKLDEECSTSKLRCEGEPNNLPVEIPSKCVSTTKLQSYPVNEHAMKLSVVRCKVHYASTLSYEQIAFKNRRFIKQALAPTLTITMDDVFPGTDFIYSILVYKPFSFNFVRKYISEKLRFAYELEVLGSNTLAQLVDQIKCFSNMCLFKEVENTKVDLKSNEMLPTQYVAQTVFIEGVFYNDYRDTDIDLSEGVIRWAKEKNIGTFTSKSMESVTLSQVKPRLGYPYVYIHQGNCEHIISFSDAALVTKSLSSKNYPRIASLSNRYNIQCFICTHMPALWMVLNCDKFPQEKVFLCTQCCDSYLYIDGKKVSDFKLYPYRENLL